jgi:GNAT superfamily N-acetyltransferase
MGGGWKGKAKRREMKTPFMHYLIATESPAQLPADANAGTAAAQPPPLGFVSLLFDVEDGCEVGYVSPHFSSVLVSSTRISQLTPCTTAHTLLHLSKRVWLAREPTPLISRCPPCAITTIRYCYEFQVASHARRRGVGSALMDALVRVVQSAGMTKVTLRT